MCCQMRKLRSVATREIASSWAISTKGYVSIASYVGGVASTTWPTCNEGRTCRTQLEDGRIVAMEKRGNCLG